MLQAQEQALKLLEQEMDQLAHLRDEAQIDLNTFKSTIGVAKEDTVHVSNFPYAYNENDLRALFKDCGEIRNVNAPEDRMLQ